MLTTNLFAADGLPEMPRVSPFAIELTAPSQNFVRIANQVDGVACAQRVDALENFEDEQQYTDLDEVFAN